MAKKTDRAPSRVRTINISLETFNNLLILQEIVNLDLSFYTDVEFKAAWNHAYISGGMTAYEWADRREIRNFIPFRMDYLMGAGLTFGGFTLGWAHGCFHRVLPGAMIYPYGRASQGRVD